MPRQSISFQNHHRGQNLLFQYYIATVILQTIILSNIKVSIVASFQLHHYHYHQRQQQVHILRKAREIKNDYNHELFPTKCIVKSSRNNHISTKSTTRTLCLNSIQNDNNNDSADILKKTQIQTQATRREALATSAASILAIGTTIILPQSSNALPNALVSTTSTPIVTSTTTVPSSSTSSASFTTTIQETISGFISGITVTTTKTIIKYPLDTASVRLQMKSTPYSTKSIHDIISLFKGK